MTIHRARPKGKGDREGKNARRSKAVVSIFMITLLVLASASLFFSEKNDDDYYDQNIFLGSEDVNDGMFRTVSAGGSHSLALRSDGTVWAWGYNNHGQLGNFTFTDSSRPMWVSGFGGPGVLTDVTAIAAGEYHSIALKDDGTVWAWGHNSNGQLGDGTTARS
ncbi:MAG: hypothetical protein LBE47_03805, partial [Methanomassiliicoccaceae archaeon]|nr:hypothetical protein [Methanomassiliicoccaceae archaeon]